MKQCVAEIEDAVQLIALLNECKKWAQPVMLNMKDGRSVKGVVTGVRSDSVYLMKSGQQRASVYYLSWITKLTYWQAEEAGYDPQGQVSKLLWEAGMTDQILSTQPPWSDSLLAEALRRRILADRVNYESVSMEENGMVMLFAALMAQDMGW